MQLWQTKYDEGTRGVLTDAIEEQTKQAKQLDLTIRPRKKRNSDVVIAVDPKRKQAGQHKRTMIVTLDCLWGWDNPALVGYGEQRRIEGAA